MGVGMNFVVRSLFTLAFVTVVVLGVDAQVEGLWVVTKVQAGEEEMTPDGRWTRFNADQTFESGNGWYQHTVGKWNFNETSGQIKLENINMPADEFGAFSVEIMGDKMVWSRSEDGNLINITLNKQDILPQSRADKVMGLWQLNSIEGSGPYASANTEPGMLYLYLGWDRKFRLTSKDGTLYGVYNVHAHKPEIEFIPYGEGMERSWWKMSSTMDEFHLHLLNSDTEVKRTFERAAVFPD